MMPLADRRHDLGLVGPVLAAVFLLSATRLVAAAAPIAPTPANWSAEGNVEFPPPGSEAVLRINSGDAVLRNTLFENGSIEYDVAELPGAAGMDFPWMRFRERDAGTAEELYLRPEADCPHSDDCIQYAPVVHGSLLWDIYPQFQAGGPVRATGWNHVRAVVSGHRLRVYVNGSPRPMLAVDTLEGEPGSGSLAFNGPALYRDLVVRADDAAGMPPSSPGALEDQRLVASWQVAAPSIVPPGPMPPYASMPGASAGWAPIHAEPSGLVNLSRRYAPPERGEGEVAWLKTVVRSNADRTMRVRIGWAREVAVFVNGQPVFADRNFYFGLDATRRRPDGRLSLDNGAFTMRLHRGSNEIAVAVNDFFPGSAVHAGWGLALQVEDLGGITLAR